MNIILPKQEVDLSILVDSRKSNVNAGKKETALNWRYFGKTKEVHEGNIVRIVMRETLSGARLGPLYKLERRRVISAVNAIYVGTRALHGTGAWNYE